MGYLELARAGQREASLWVARFDLLREHLGDEEEQRERGLARLAEMKRLAEERAKDTGKERRARLQANLESRYHAGLLQDKAHIGTCQGHGGDVEEY
ncbi:hypothetical protein B0H65DRAFT_550241 [Neurospora tetraspora]|uniref:Uncharacterized protein n=1 Tax=Neurospora tetraspora TaxID=94610 RepID=A0AAE0JDI6_9PEZI|nr:hypothetical protein B0H65DRAFT_550241 [Neurospora tetraspora]